MDIKNITIVLCFSILLFFFAIYAQQAIVTMKTVPFYEFDEAHRAEQAKRMREYKSYFIPLTGSQFDRISQLSIPFKDNSILNLYYHPERPFLVYLLMIISTSLLLPEEFAYRFPSFLFGICTLIAFFLFGFRRFSNNFFALIIGLTVIVRSRDLWLSSMYAQLDTGLTLFLFLSLVFIIKYCEQRKSMFLCFSGLSFALAVLSKGQPAVIFAIPLLALFFLKKLTFRELRNFFLFSALLLVPWAILVSSKIGFEEFVRAFVGFAFASTSLDVHHAASPFWYGRWWVDTFRLGLVLFMAFFIRDVFSKNLDWKKITIASYCIGGLLVFSLQANKIWWYVLPMIPAIALYVFFSTYDYLKIQKDRLINIAIVIGIGSLFTFFQRRNFETLVYGAIIIFFSFLILRGKFSFYSSIPRYGIFILSIVLSLHLFNQRFPSIKPYYDGVKETGQYFSKLAGKKCLWGYDMPFESALFYSNAGEISPLNDATSRSRLFYDCDHNYLITPQQSHDPALRYVANTKVIFQKNQILLLELGKHPGSYYR